MLAHDLFKLKNGTLHKQARKCLQVLKEFEKGGKDLKKIRRQLVADVNVEK